MGNTENKTDKIVEETMKELYDSIEKSQKIKEQIKAEDELAKLQAELDEEEEVKKTPEVEEAKKKAEEARRKAAQARKKAAAKKAADDKKAASEARKRATVKTEVEIPKTEVPKTEVSQTEEGIQGGDKSLKKGRFKRIALITLASILGVVFVAYAGFAIFFSSHFMFNTTVNGKDYSLKAAKDVAEDMESQVQGYTLTIHESDGDSEEIKGSDIALKYVPTDELDNLVKGQNNILWLMTLWENQELETKVSVQYDEMKLDTILKNLPCMDPENQVESENAKPKFNGTQFEVGAEVVGTEIDEPVFVEAVNHAVTAFESELNLAETECYLLPEYTSTSQEVIEACELMNVYVSSEIKYDFHPETEVVDAEKISEWLFVNKDMEVKIRSTKMKEYLAKLGKKYDTWGKPREFTTASGNKVTVTGGAYGWLLNEAEEFKQLKKDIKKGEKIEREPIFYGYATAVEHTDTDWGDTYAEVDLTNQKMYFIKDGNVVLESYVVTGNPNKGCATPQGVYSLTYKTKDAVLRGERDENGKPEYETPVAYWMPFNGGIGFHDATWQSSFGGSRYLTNGSHGCVNMPKDKAAKLYELIPNKCPVICHY